MINIFETSFEARDRRFQIEKLYHGETVDLVGVVTTNGVPQNITGYAVSGVFQPTSMNGSPDFYELSADIVDNKVIVHWEKGKDFGENSYMVWALLTDGDNASYPIAWRLDMAYSPSYPLSDLAPIPKTIDFDKYDLLNAPWLELSAFDEFVDGLSNEYLPLSGGVVSGDFEVKDFLKGAKRSLVIGKNNVQQYSDRGVALGTNLSTNVAAVAIGDNTRAGNSSIAIGQSSEAGDGSGIVIGNNSKTYSNSIAIGAQTSANYSQSIAIGNEASTTKMYEVRLGGPYQSQYGQPSLYVHDIPILSGSDHRIPKERLPYLSGYAKKEEIPEVPTDLSAFTNSPGYATSAYVQEYVDEHSGGDYLPLSGGNLSGRIYLETTATSSIVVPGQMVTAMDLSTLKLSSLMEEAGMAGEDLGMSVQINASFADMFEGSAPLNSVEYSVWCYENGVQKYYHHGFLYPEFGDPEDPSTFNYTYSVQNDYDNNGYADMSLYAVEDDINGGPTGALRFSTHLYYDPTYDDETGDEIEPGYDQRWEQESWLPTDLADNELAEEESRWFYPTTETVGPPTTAEVEVTVEDPFILSSELTAAIGDINSILDNINGEII